MAYDFVTADARNKLQDLSGIVIKEGENPYDALIQACNDDASQIQTLYSAHRTRRNEQQRAKFLADDFAELVVDPYLMRLQSPAAYPGFVDDRNGIVIWARPPNHVVRLAEKLQRMLQETAPNIWLMPTYCMHMTALELIHSRTPAYTSAAIGSIRASVPSLTNYTFTHRARLVKPMISYDLSAFAVSFLPASSEPALSPAPVIVPADNDPVVQGNAYTYHHLRRDLFSAATEAGAEINSRYQVPSAHITLGRYLGADDHATPEARRRWVERIDEVNRWLENEVWNCSEGEWVGEWVVGQERGLDCRVGALWYGGGRTVMLGEGF